MRTLVTGATGFVGRHLLPRLKRPVILSRSGSKNRGALNPYDVTAYDWSPRRGPPPEQAFDNVDVVVHLAGENVASGRWTRAKKQRIRASRVQGTTNLVTALAGLAKPPRLLISASAVGYYGSRGEELLTESSSPGDDFLADVCVAWEAAAMAAADVGVRVVTLRTGLVLGPGGGALDAMLKPFRWGLGGRLGSGQQWISWIHLDDLVELILFLRDHETIHGPVNVTSPTPCRNADFTQVLAEAVHRPAVLPVPAPMLRLALGQFSSVLLASQRAIPELALRSGFHFRYPEVDEALKASLQ